jgi:hypothetical protein
VSFCPTCHGAIPPDDPRPIRGSEDHTFDLVSGARIPPWLHRDYVGPLTLPLFAADGQRWARVSRRDPRARLLADAHYSRQTIGAPDFLSSGRTLCLLTDDARAVWGAIENLDPAGARRWRVSIFRNEGAGLSSLLIAEATSLTFGYWERHYHGRPRGTPLRTEVDPARVRAKRDPGRCFIRAGWKLIGRTTAHTSPKLVFEAPGQ